MTIIRWQHFRSQVIVCLLWSASMLLGLAAFSCAGCRGGDSQQTPEQTKEQAERASRKLAEERKKEEPLEIGPLLPQLGQAHLENDAEAQLPKILVKPGHWTPTVQQMRANLGDFVGTASTTLVDEQQQPVPVEGTQFIFQSMRSVVLAKGREKVIEGKLFVPEQDAATHVRSRLTSRDSGGVVHLADPQLARMPSYQYFIVVLAKEASRYAFLKVTDSIRAEWEEEFEEPSQAHYRVVLADPKEGIPLPSSLFSWSSIAYLVWDEVDPAELSAEQQQALVDWLHWGGRLIVNGPDSLDTLRASFLDEYLPAQSKGSREFTADVLRDWSKMWSNRISGSTLAPLAPARTLSGVKLAPRVDAREVGGGGGLFYERSIGLGNIVVSAVQLNQSELVNWPGYDGFLNAALLRRPQRRFSEGPYGGLRVDWFDHRGHRLDAQFVTGLRLFAHDAAAAANVRSEQQTQVNQFGLPETSSVTQVDRPGGLGSWSDFGPVATASRDLLVEAAGVQMPGAGFIVACLAVYLLVLVPLNWMVFYTLGRVEWAWFAAPVIAVLGTYGVVRLAQLDIGIVRSQTEIALLELQGAHPRGLLSRYAALYSSLSTTYDVTFDQQETVAVPFASGEEESPSLGDRQYEVTLETDPDTVLRGLAVASNSTRMLHSEQVFPLAGPLKLGLTSRNHYQLVNHSGLNLRDVAVVRRHFKEGDDRPSYDASWIGELRHGASSALGLTPYAWAGDRIPFAEEREQAARESSIERMQLDELLKLAFQFPDRDDPQSARREEYRLVGRIDEVLPGAEVSPAASQIRGATVVLAHLQYGDQPVAQPDVNSRGDLDLTTTDLFDDEPNTDD